MGVCLHAKLARVLRGCARLEVDGTSQNLVRIKMASRAKIGKPGKLNVSVEMVDDVFVEPTVVSGSGSFIGLTIAITKPEFINRRHGRFIVSLEQECTKV